jgi:hypothetical protein
MLAQRGTFYLSVKYHLFPKIYAFEPNKSLTED